MPARIGALLFLWAATATAAPVRVRFPEGITHGILRVTDTDGATVARGELLQWLEGPVVASRLVIRFDDGSLYDELVRFTQRPAFRVESYHQVYHGPSFTETLDAAFERSGHYRVRRRPTPDADEQQAEGHFDVPDDVSNGMAAVLLKNLPAGASATTHVLAFRPKPMTLELRLAPEGADRYRVGPATAEATRFVVQPRVTGVTGAVATVAGKQPEPLHMWITPGPTPTLVRFEGSLYTGGPWWRVEPSSPEWETATGRSLGSRPPAAASRGPASR